MTDDPWGADTPAAFSGRLPPLPPDLAELEAFLSAHGPFGVPPGWEPPTEADLPEVKALVDEGWCLVDRMPGAQLLPAVWPSEHRAWVPDWMLRVVLELTVEGTFIRRPRAERGAEAEAFVAQEAASADLPPPPAGRIWMLRSPWPSLSVAMVLAVLHQWRDKHELWMPDGPLVAAREVLGWSEEQVWGWWSGPQADAARAWRAVGRPASEASDLVLAGLGPEETARLTSPIESGGAGLTEAQAASWLDRIFRPSVGEAVEVIIGWRALGLPAKPRERGWMTLNEMEPGEAAEWLAEGFTFDEVSALHGIATLEAARRWREHGYAAERARDLLLADGSLTPDEASAFDAAGLEPDAVIGWVATGFSAEEARGWTDVDVLPMEARVWRSVGLRPDDARRQKAGGGGVLPDGVSVGWTAFGDTRREHRRYGATDPPGTRGSVAAESRDMRDLLRDD